MRHIAILSLVAFSGVMAVPATADDAKFGAVTGTVTFKGKPLPGGTISFHTENAKITSPILDGKFEVKKVPVGTARVAVETESVKPKDGVKPPMNGGDPVEKTVEKRADDVPRRYVPIPVKYAKPETSGLTFEVKEGKQELNVELKD